MPLHIPYSCFDHLSWRINSNFYVHRKPEVRTLFLLQATTTWVDVQNISLLQNDTKLLALMKRHTWPHLCKIQIANCISSANPLYKVVNRYDQLQGMLHTGERRVAENLLKHRYLVHHHQDHHSLVFLARHYPGCLSQMI
jgi:hypothetical protein